MSRLHDRNHRRQTSVSGNNSVSAEILEPRWMNAASPLQVLATSNPSPTPVNKAPVLVKPLSVVNGTDIPGRTATVSVLGSDDKGEATLTYSWLAVTKPAGAIVSFSSNGTNAAKNSTVTFSRAGTYTLRVLVRDREGLTTTSTSEVQVVQTFTSLSIKTSDGKSVTAGAIVGVAGTSGRLSAVAMDQFGNAMTTQPSIAWQVLAAPAGGTANLSTEGAAVSVVVSRAGKYDLRARSGATSANVSLSVAQTLSTINLATLGGDAISADQSVTITETSLRMTMRGFDQFGNEITSLPAISWTATSVPTGGKMTRLLANGVEKISFNRPGDYVVRAASGKMTFSFSTSVVATLTGINFRTPENRVLAANGVLSVTGTSQRLVAVGLDQFGIALADQPQIQWQLMTSPAGANTNLDQADNSLLITPDRSGAYAMRAQSGSVLSNLTVNLNQALSSLNLLTTGGSAIDPAEPIAVSGISQSFHVRGFDQFGNAMVTMPAIKWTATTAPTGGTATTRISAGIAATTFTRAGGYALTAQAGSLSSSVAFQVSQTLTRIAAFGTDNRTLNPNTPVIISGTTQRLNAIGLDQFSQAMTEQPAISWRVVTEPTGSSAALDTNGNETTLSFNRCGAYAVRAECGTLTLSLRMTLAQRSTSFRITPGTLSISAGASQQFVAQALDQFEQPLTTQPVVTWSATGGTITSRGLFIAGSSAGNFAVTARTTSSSTTAAVTVTAVSPSSVLRDATLASLVNTYYADGQLNRLEMMDLLRSAGNDGVVNANELADFQLIVSSSSPFSMPSYVKSLASDVVNSNPANRYYRGQTAGNLAAGSSSTLLNNLVNKWFMGTDEPVISGTTVTYQTSTGNLFNSTPSRADARQGMLGDCYFIAALASIADKNPNAVRNMFTDNGDGTYTVRFYSGVAIGASKPDYVTVNRRLPSFANGTLAYSGYGLGISSSTTTLWIAIAEKAYAQWNEKGRAGRDGTNRYAAIEGGWMSNVNAQVLGYNSSNYSLTTSNQQTLINAVTSGKATTIGTVQNASAGGLYGSHAYIVTGYNSTAGTFTLHNPWGTSHPSPLTFGQLQASCSMFIVADPTNTGPISAPVNVRVRSTVANQPWNAGTNVLHALPMTARMDTTTSEQNDPERPSLLASPEASIKQDFDLDSFLLETVGPGLSPEARFTLRTTLLDAEFPDGTDSLIDMLMMDFNLDEVLC